MAEFSTLIKSSKIQAAYSVRQATLEEISRNVNLIKDLDQENPNGRTFNRLESNANKSIDELKLASRELDMLLIRANLNFNDDESYKADQKLVRKQQFLLFDEIDKYTQLLHSKDIPYPPDVKPVTSSGDLAASLNNLVESQNRIMTTLDKNLTAVVTSQDKNIADLSKSLVDQIKSNASSRSGPKALQPKFKPKGNDSDYAEFNDFLSKFEFFTAKCSTDLEKLQWLKTSVEGQEAVGLIKHFSLSNENYPIALNRLKERYSDPDVVKHSLFQSILSFKCEAGPKFSKTLAAMTAFENTLEELKTTHKLPIGESLCKELLREICFYNLPSDVRRGLIEATGSNYPPIADILTNLNKVITKLNITGYSSSSTKINSELNMSNSKEVSTFNVNHSKLNTSNNEIKKHKCLFCSNTEHPFWKCNQIKSKDERLSILKKKFPDNCISCGFKHKNNSQNCYWKSKCPDNSCTNANGKHNRLTCPKFVQSTTTSVHQVSVVPQSINASSIEGKSVALPTAVYTAINSNALNLPIEQRNIAILADSAAQRTLVSKETVDRLGLDIIGTERACLIGYGNKKPQNNSFNVVSISLGLPRYNNSVKFDAYVVDKLNPVHMAGVAKFAKKLQNKGLNLADWRLINNKSDIVDFQILVGADHYYKIVNPYKLPIERLGMYLGFDRFGRNFLFGRIPGSTLAKKQQQVNFVSIHSVGCNPSLKNYAILNNNEFVDESNAFDVVRELNNFDAMGFQVSSRAEDDIDALKTFTSNMYKDKNTNQYVVGFPWTNDIPPSPEELDSDYGLVLARFKDIMKSLDKDENKLQQYKETHEKEASMDFIERVPLDELNDKNVFKHYINHFPVFNQESATTKCRRVFDASLHKRGKACLNDKMLKGSQLTPHILKVLLRTRIMKNLVTLDISKAFLRMVLKLSDRNFTCFFLGIILMTQIVLSLCGDLNQCSLVRHLLPLC